MVLFTLGDVEYICFMTMSQVAHQKEKDQACLECFVHVASHIFVKVIAAVFDQYVAYVRYI